MEIVSKPDFKSIKLILGALVSRTALLGTSLPIEVTLT